MDTLRFQQNLENEVREFLGSFKKRALFPASDYPKMSTTTVRICEKFLCTIESEINQYYYYSHEMRKYAELVTVMQAIVNHFGGWENIEPHMQIIQNTAMPMLYNELEILHNTFPNFFIKHSDDLPIVFENPFFSIRYVQKFKENNIEYYKILFDAVPNEWMLVHIIKDTEFKIGTGTIIAKGTFENLINTIACIVTI